MSNIDISNKDLLAQKAKQKDDSQGNTIRDSILRPGPRLSAYRSDDCVLSKQNTLSNGKLILWRQSYKNAKVQEKNLDFL